MRILSILLLLATPALAAPPELRLPLDCRLGESCWLMNLPDVDPGPEARDFRCHGRSYDGHDGTDVAVRDGGTDMVVVAPAVGLVHAVRDGEPDGAFLAGGDGAVKGKECGNGVLLRHHDGWETQLCHMRAGSVTVKPGQLVKAGEPLGRVGLSGKSAFPHVHMGLRRHDEKLDPFTGRELGAGCRAEVAPLWPVAYQRGAVYAAGFRDHLPEADALKKDAGSPALMAAGAPALVLWGTLFGVEAGDVVRLVLRAPGGSEAARRDTPPLPKAQAWRMEAVGVKAKPGGLAPGPWLGEVTLLRAGKPVDGRKAVVEVRP